MEQQSIQELLTQGFSIIPVKRREKKAAVAWTEFQTKHPTPDQITIWQNHGYANFAVITGKISGIIVVDVDNEEAYNAVLQLGIPENTPTVYTGKGVHLYFAYPTELANRLNGISNGVNVAQIKGLDLRGDGGYVLAAGSIHPSGAAYRWHIAPKNPVQNFENVFPSIPKWLETFITARANGETKGAGAASDVPALGDGGQIIEGGRNNAMHRIASALRTRGRSYREILERLKHENQERCRPLLSENELEIIAQSAARYKPEIGDYHLTESGNAQRLLDLFSDEIVYSPTHKRWLIWNGHKWSIDGDNEAVLKYAQNTAFSILDDAANASDEKMKKSLFKFSQQSQQLKSLKACITIAKSHHSVQGTELDKNQWILNCPNGIVDLKTGKLKEHDKGEFCTRVCGAEFHEHAECPRWLSFIDEITAGDEALQRYLQRIVGYSLTGDTSEHVWFMLLGNGRNGKSTFLNAIQSMLGDYSSNIRPEALLMQGMDKVPNDLAALKGSRFAAASETPASRKLNESLIKQLTGGDKIQARFLFSEYFEFTPQCKLFLATNYRPNIQGTDIGIWRRTHEVPFPASIPEDKVDPNLQYKLEEEISGILAWAIRGCLEWQKGRLQPPQAVQLARAEYYEEMDTVGQFLKEWCSVDSFPKESEKTEHVKFLYHAFVGWCMENSEEVLTKKSFGMKLNQRNIPSIRMSDGGRGRQGIRLRAHHTEKTVGRGLEWRIEAE